MEVDRVSAIYATHFDAFRDQARASAPHLPAGTHVSLLASTFVRSGTLDIRVVVIGPVVT